ncbi:hypothetical protein H7171_02775 [Candidatus Saccharibacteria bacterium]|nr:hypothetical protein [Candidatus Saccharibacteria bacterium]
MIQTEFSTQQNVCNKKTFYKIDTYRMLTVAMLVGIVGTFVITSSSAATTSSAELYETPSSGSNTTGQSFSVAVRVPMSGSNLINYAHANLAFNFATLKVTSLSTANVPRCCPRAAVRTASLNKEERRCRHSRHVRSR